MRRQTSWRDKIRTLTGSGTDTDSPSVEGARPLKRVTTRSGLPSRSRSNTLAEEGALADGESSESDDNRDDGPENAPLMNRIRYVYPHAVPNPVKVPWSKSSLDLQQAALSKAIEEEDREAGARRSELAGKQDGVEPIGTRLTMTSRSGFFNDRIINPSMVGISFLSVMWVWLTG